MNLLTNACQAVPDSGVVRVAVRRHGEHVVVSVTDSGPGIPQEVRDRIFEPFFTTKPLGLGTGLGLAISYNIVCNKHRRDIGFFCPSDGGTTFTVSLPLKQPPRHGTTTAELPAETLVAARSAREASP
jgi:two-component system NtrC family sensor kinase